MEMIPEYQQLYDELDHKYQKIMKLKEEFKDIQKEFGIKKENKKPDRTSLYATKPSGFNTNP